MRCANALRGVLVVVVMFTLAACGSSGGHAGSTTPPPSATSPVPSAPSSTRPAPPTTRHDNPVADDQLAQLALTSSLSAAKSIYQHTYDYTAVSPASLAAIVPNVKFVPLGQANATAVGVLAQDRHDVFFVTRSASGRWYCITENDTDGVSYGTGSSYGAIDSNGKCQQPNW
jgi:hypothetical protein